MTADDFITKAIFEQPKNFCISSALEMEKVLNSVNIEEVPLKL